ncbi:PorT family protein [Pedobacter sp. SD-b]|uniref:PorT family protein n=1 Tax=Pedobacter segetis TaxID=2793069 RepID=A0ABS1BF34_9SPHI|nr:porin family protein [Pedobacter segetis]MBK0381487.1 PorT family protein [Pedobacter segetis]
MKKLFITSFALLFAGLVNAQSTKSGLPSFGIKGGVNFANIIKTDNPDYKTDYNTGFNAGVFVNIPIISPLSFQPELMFSQKGFKSTQTLGTVTQTTNWIEVPILAKISPGNGFNIVIGPQVSFLTKTNNKFEGSFTTSEQTKYENDADKFKKSILGGVVGIGFDLTSRLGINGRYALDFQKNNENGTTETPVYKNQVWQAGLAVKF